MRRTGIVVGVLLLSASLAVASASVADAGVHVVRSPAAFPLWDYDNTPLAGVERIGCADPMDKGTGGSPDVSYHKDAAPPLGERVWQVDDVTGGVGSAVGPSLLAPDADSLTVATVAIDPDTAMTGVASVLLFDFNTLQASVGVATLPNASPGWQTLSSNDRVYHWRGYDLATGTYAGGSGVDATYSRFTYDRSWTGVAKFVFAYGCQDTASFRTDKWVVGDPGTPGSETTYDLEGTATRVGISSKPTITAGNALAVSGDLTDADLGVLVSGPLVLQALPHGASDYVQVAETSTGAGGEPARLIVHPLVTTTYRWVSPASDCCEASMSAPVTVEVRTALTAALKDKTVSKGSELIVNGRTNPAKPGTTVTLWRKTATVSKKLATGKVNRNGSYRVTTRARSRGTWKLFVTVPAVSGNLAGTSPVRTAKVS